MGLRSDFDMALGDAFVEVSDNADKEAECEVANPRDKLELCAKHLCLIMFMRISGELKR